MGGSTVSFIKASKLVLILLTSSVLTPFENVNVRLHFNRYDTVLIFGEYQNQKRHSTPGRACHVVSFLTIYYSVPFI